MATSTSYLNASEPKTATKEISSMDLKYVQIAPSRHKQERDGKKEIVELSKSLIAEFKRGLNKAAK